jgi:hypothetical protein
MSDLSDFLPVVLNRNPEYTEPSVDTLSKKAKNALARLEVKRQKLQEEGAVASGDTVAILAAGQNAWGREAEAEAIEHVMAAERIARFLKTIGIVNVDLIEGARLEDVLATLRDPSISDLMYVGHAERSNLILEKTATWKTAAEQADHLKHSIGLVGCSTSFKDTISPRFGTLLIPDDGLLYGKQEGAARPSEMGDLGNFYALDRQMTDFDTLDLDVYRPRSSATKATAPPTVALPPQAPPAQAA